MEGDLPDPLATSDPKERLRNRLLEIAGLFTRLGFTAFGGHAAHVSMMEDEVVVRRRWLDRQHFLDAYAAVSFIPGPTSTELALHLGCVRAGFAGLLTAGFCFIIPAVLIILPIAWAYVQYGELKQVHGMMVGVNAAVVAIVTAACARFAMTAIRNPFGITVAVGAIIMESAWLWFHHAQPDLLVLAIAALAGIIREGGGLRRRMPAALMPLLAGPLPHAAATVSSGTGGLLQLAGVFLKIGATLFGSGYVLITYLQSSVVDQHRWMTRDELLNAISVGQFTPGPILTTATFIGYIRGWQLYHTKGGAIAGALVATAAIFAPAFLLIACVGRYFVRLRKNRWARAALDAVNAAVVSLIAIAAVRLGSTALVITEAPRRYAAIAVFLVTLYAMLRHKVNATWMILAGAAVGLALP